MLPAVPTDEELARTIDAQLELLGVDAASVARHPGATIVPPELARTTATGRALELIEQLRKVGRSTASPLELHSTLGEGGMGVVWRATQTALAREVAVKSLKEGHAREPQMLKLLREAWVTGALEHPNIVPVHDIAVDEHGRPLIVLKKIGGRAWHELITDDSAVRERFGTDLDAWNLSIFLAVCNAVRYAHAQSIVHRDLKPENVMIGEFGEVYLLDWGIAVSMEDDLGGRFPLARDAETLAGTPAYMAPEMLGGGGTQLTPRTDVYLLGAILHEIAVGQPPHVGESLMEIVRSVARSEPELPPSVAPELGDIIRRAMSREPDDRHQSVDELAEDVRSFLSHEGSRALAADAFSGAPATTTRRSSASPGSCSGLASASPSPSPPSSARFSRAMVI
jgi:serine/threonine-protein kinase